MPVEDQVRDLLRRAVPDTAPISFDAVVQGAHRRRIAMTLTVAAAAACVIAGAVTAIALAVTHSSDESHTTPAHHPKSSREARASGSHSCFRPGHRYRPTFT